MRVPVPSDRVRLSLSLRRSALSRCIRVFVTDRSTWPRSVKALEQSDPNLVQLMPAPMLSHLSKQDRKALPPIVTSGFVCNKGDVFDALKNGAVAVSTSDSELWNLDPER
ncbi:glycerol-3-phosphate responsive antiterminator [Paraburkholderia sediminicola]